MTGTAVRGLARTIVLSVLASTAAWGLTYVTSLSLGLLALLAAAAFLGKASRRGYLAIGLALTLPYLALMASPLMGTQTNGLFVLVLLFFALPLIGVLAGVAALADFLSRESVGTAVDGTGEPSAADGPAPAP